MTTPYLFEQLELLVKRKGRLYISHDADGDGMGFYWCATIGGKWPYCSAGTLEGALQEVVKVHLRIEREALEKRLTEIDNSAQL